MAPELKNRPNILMFMPDQLRYDCVGAFGNDKIKTPNIDKLASNGTKFTNCFLQHSVCSQSRCSIYTSNYSHVHGHRGLNSLIQPYEDNFFKHLKQNGYHVAILAPRGDLFAADATELSCDEYGFIVPPQQQFSAGLKKDVDVTKLSEIELLWGRLFYRGTKGDDPVLDYDLAAIKSAELWLKTPPSDKPWCLFLPLIFPHCPFAVEEPYFSMYDRTSVHKPAKLSDKTGYEPAYMDRFRKDMGTDKTDDDTWAEVIATYYGMITRVDDQLGKIMDCVESNEDIKNNTVTFFYTDHGDYLGDYSLIEKWPAGVSDSLVHEPLIISGPGIPKNRTVDSLCEMIDLGPTIFELCGIDPKGFPHFGKSLLPQINDLNFEQRQYVFSEGGFLLSEEPIIEYAAFPYDIKATLQHTDTHLVGRVVAARNKDYTYVYRLYEEDEFYSRAEDPHELHNVVKEERFSKEVAKFKEKLLEWIIATSDHAPFKIDDRFPKVSLESPSEQLAKRISAKQNA